MVPRHKFLVLTLLALTLTALLPIPTPMLRAADETQPAIDWNKARTLYQRSQKGEALTPEEQAYLDRAKAERARAQAAGATPGAASAAPANPPRESTGMVPLSDLTGDARYKDQEGGLYGKGSNDIPEAHKKSALARAAKVTPLDAEGHPAADGKIGLLAIGMSNTTMEFSEFKKLADQDPRKNQRLVIVDGAQGGMDAAAWLDKTRGPQVWQTAENRIKNERLTDQQIQIVWIKQALIQPARLGEFPKHADVLKDDLLAIAQLAQARYPNLRLAYLSNRTYAGYATTALNPEPYSYESAFAVRSAILAQINAAPGTSPNDGKTPLLLWGPYLWTDGTKGRKSDDVTWTAKDVAADGTHPSAAGREKVASMLMNFFSTDPTTKSWFLTSDAPPK